jgi:hypothetical protein
MAIPASPALALLGLSNPNEQIAAEHNARAIREIDGKSMNKLTPCTRCDESLT